MKPLVINVRGTSGSGKTYLTRQFMAAGKDKVRLVEKKSRKILGYRFRIPGCQRPWAVLGTYENVCGGCDTIRTQEQVVQRVKKFSAAGYNVWLEGLLISSIDGTVGQYAKTWGQRWVYAFLDTPLEKCLERVNARRRQRGQMEPVPPKNTESKFKGLLRGRKVLAERGGRVLVLTEKYGFATLLKLAKAEG